MKIIFSPTKIQNDKPNQRYIPLKHQDKIDYLNSIINNLDIQKHFKLSDKAYQKYLDHQNGCDFVINQYQGLTFKQLNKDQYNQTYLNNHLVVLSSLYGPLKPNDIIKFYRLDQKFKPLNLYEYWQSTIIDFFKDEDFIISLASKEYEQMLANPQLQDKIITITFTSPSMSNTKTKMLRGKFLDAIILNQITSIDQLKKLEVEQFKFNQKASTSNLFNYTSHI